MICKGINSVLVSHPNAAYESALTVLESDTAGEGDEAAVGVLEAVHGLPGLGLGAQLA